MSNNETQYDASILKTFSTARLEGLLPELLKELRARDCNHIKRDAISSSRAVRLRRNTGKLP